MRSWYKSLSTKPDLVVLLQPTHPLRNPNDITSAIELIQNNSEADSLVTVIPMSDSFGKISSGVYLPEVPVQSDKSRGSKLFKVTGSFYIFRPTQTFMTTANLGNKILAYELAHPEFEVNIDYEHDFIYAEAIMKKYPEFLSMYD